MVSAPSAAKRPRMTDTITQTERLTLRVPRVQHVKLCINVIVVLCLLGAIVSLFIQPGCTISHWRRGGNALTRVAVRLSDGSVQFNGWSGTVIDAAGASGFRFGYTNHRPKGQALPWVLPVVDNGGIRIPLVVLASVLVLLARFAPRWVPPRVVHGRCAHCDYSLEGLMTTTCPECGATITHD